MSYDTALQAAQAAGLDIYGGFHPNSDDGCPDNTQTLLMLGPREPDFWTFFQTQPEYQDAQPDPIDRWSTRVIGALAQDLGATALFPFGGPPFQPFVGWAKRTGRAWASPVGILVHDQAGLFVSYRGALAFADKLELPALPAKPCDSCTDKPCLTACPVGAMGDHAYDVPACKDYLRQPDQTCLSHGCQVRRICPLSQTYGRDPRQSGYHMKAFVVE